jgi:cytochrome P450
MLSWRAMAIHVPMVCWPPKSYVARLVRLALHGDVVPMSLYRRIFLVNDPEIVKVICQQPVALVSKQTYHYGQFAKCMGEGLLTLDGTSWSSARQRCQKAFWPDAIDAHDDLLDQHIDRWRHDWLAVAARNGYLDVHADIATRLFALSTEILLGVSLSNAQASETYALMASLVDQSVASPWLTMRAMATRFHRGVAKIDRWLLGIAQASHVRKSLLAPIVTALAQQKITKAQFLGEVKNILFGSFDTTSLCLTWGCYELARHESIQHQLATSMAAGTKKYATALEMYQGCDSVRHLIQEVLRLYPAVYGVERRLHEVPVALRHLFKANTLLRISPYLLHRHPRYWQHPEAFYPDRFKQDRPATHRYAYCPYLLGPRNCIGQHLANAIMAKVWSSLLPKVGLSLSAKAPIAMGARLTLRPAGPVVLKLGQRL